jgi:hypothetical protein
MNDDERPSFTGCRPKSSAVNHGCLLEAHSLRPFVEKAWPLVRHLEQTEIRPVGRKGLRVRPERTVVQIDRGERFT